MHIIHPHLTYIIDFGEFRINSFLLLLLFFTGAHKNSYRLLSKELKYQNLASVSKVITIKPKFYVHTVDRRSSRHINFGVRRMYSFLQDAKNVIN